MYTYLLAWWITFNNVSKYIPLKTGLEIHTQKPANLFLGVVQLSCTFPLYWVSTEDDLRFVARLGFLFELSQTRLFQVATALKENKLLSPVKSWQRFASGLNKLISSPEKE